MAWHHSFILEVWQKFQYSLGDLKADMNQCSTRRGISNQTCRAWRAWPGYYLEQTPCMNNNRGTTTNSHPEAVLNNEPQDPPTQLNRPPHRIFRSHAVTIYG